MDPSRTGQRVVAGRYLLRDELGRGGMGVVWLAEDQLLGRQVAVKEVTFGVDVTEEERAVLRGRTFGEARAATPPSPRCTSSSRKTASPGW